MWTRKAAFTFTGGIALVLHFIPQVNGGGDHGVVGAPCLGFVGGTGGSRRSTLVHGVEGRGRVVVQPDLLRGAHPGELTEQGRVAIEGCFERANERVCLRNRGLVGNEGSFPSGKNVVAEVTRCGRLSQQQVVGQFGRG